jgi:beta-lactam-binding protein with PASTA domain
MPAGDVISQNPAASTVVAFGSAVDLVVSTGPCAMVPDVVGETRSGREER